MLTKKITKEELLIVTAARQIKDHDVCVLGVGVPILAGALAKQTHAPKAVLVMESGIVDFEPVGMPTNVADATCTRGYGYAIDMFSVFTIITYAVYLDKAFLGVAQIDKYGNINTSFLGMPPQAQRITAAGGAPDFYAYARETILTREGERLCREAALCHVAGLSGGRGLARTIRPLYAWLRPQCPDYFQGHFQISQRDQRNVPGCSFPRRERGRCKSGRSVGS
jgi:hypothetical protein